MILSPEREVNARFGNPRNVEDLARRLSAPHTAGYSRRTQPPGHVPLLLVEPKGKSVTDRQMSGVSLPTAPTDDLGFPLSHEPYQPHQPQQHAWGDQWASYQGYGESGVPVSGTGEQWSGEYHHVPAQPDYGTYDSYATGQQQYEPYPGQTAQPAQAYDAYGYAAQAEAGTAPAGPEPEVAFEATAAMPAAEFSGQVETDCDTSQFARVETAEEPAPEADSGGQPSAASPRARSRSRRKNAPRARSAFLSVAAPSLCVLGVTAVATAATVTESNSGSGSEGDPAPVAAPDPGSVQYAAANAELDTQLAGLSAAASDYGERAGQTQGEIDLERQREAEREAEEREAARQEALRPKFFVPVEQRGLSAYFGDSGVNWMSTHTGIDFPVAYGTPVMAATDGYVSTQWHPSYGNLTIVTAEDGTQTWYAHLSSSVYTSGYVQAGTVIAYSGNSGNSTGPHLHFEVRPGGGSAVDPLAWLREHGLEPT